MSERRWIPSIDSLAKLKNPQALADIHPLLLRLVEAYGHTPLSGLLDVDTEVLTRWTRGTKIDPAMSHRILDLHTVLVRAFQLFPPTVVTHWLVGHEPFLNDERPIDVLAARGAGPLIEALDAIETGTYA
jgi:hypothetical protein